MNTETYHSVWDAISDSREEAVNLKLRSQLMDILTTYIRNEGITQKEAGLRFGIPRSRVSELVNERISKFTIDKLVNMAARVGLSVLHVDHSAVSSDPSAPNTGSHRTIHGDGTRSSRWVEGDLLPLVEAEEPGEYSAN